MRLDIHATQFIAELHEAYKKHELLEFTERYIGRDPFRFFIDTENKTYRGFTALLGRYIVTVDRHDAEVTENWGSGDFICYLPAEIRRALYELGKDCFDIDAVDPEDILEV